jgi:hypothetical protein
MRLNAKREKFLRRADRSRIQRLTPMSSPSPLTNLAYIAYSTSFPSSISFNSFRLRALELSCPSFFNSRHLFSIACSLFSQNSGGWHTPAEHHPRHRSEKSQPRRSVLDFRLQTVDCRPPANFFPCHTYKIASRKSFPCHTSEKTGGWGQLWLTSKLFLSACSMLAVRKIAPLCHASLRRDVFRGIIGQGDAAKATARPPDRLVSSSKKVRIGNCERNLWPPDC